jgi:hypothetical protein
LGGPILPGAVEKSEGVLKAQNSPAVFFHRVMVRVGGELKFCNSLSESSSRGIAPSLIDSICNFDHDSSIRTPICTGATAPNQASNLSAVADEARVPAPE